MNFDNIQGDILAGLPKRSESVIIFAITQPTLFRTYFVNVIPLISTTTQAMADNSTLNAYKASGGTGLITLVGTNVAFSSAGLVQLGITDNLGDNSFAIGQKADASALVDPPVSGWQAPFNDPNQAIHGCFLVTGDSPPTVQQRIDQIQGILQGSISVVTRVDGAVRPAPNAGHEHFGFQDGLSQPPVNGFRAPDPGEDPVDPGVILIGRTGDNNFGGGPTSRPAWAIDSSFLVFRKLQQLVPEFNQFLNANPIPNMPAAQGSALLGARMVGRWKSGAPIDKDPVQDNLADTTQATVNNFDYSDDPNQVRCPFSAHLRKMNPRNSVPGGGGVVNVRPRRIMRQGITYGPEVSDQENASQQTSNDRGLLFICYQSSIDRGFHFLQQSWANNTGFPPGVPGDTGFDPIIGQSPNNQRSASGSDPANTANLIKFPLTWVLMRGGEYFLSPSMTALRTVFAPH